MPSPRRTKQAPMPLRLPYLIRARLVVCSVAVVILGLVYLVREKFGVRYVVVVCIFLDLRVTLILFIYSRANILHVHCIRKQLL